MNHVDSGRRLKALVIHDTAFPADHRAVLGTSEVELCAINIGGYEQVKIGTWGDVLQILQGISEVAPSDIIVTLDDPDLIFVDCHFNDDRQAPSIPSTRVASAKKSEIERHIDPRGLLYGAVLASFYMGRQPGRALGFAVYSQDMEAAAEDGYAQTFFSLLEALAGKINKKFVRPDEFKARMALAPKTQFPDVVLDEALAMYRTSLLRCFNDHYYPDHDSFEQAYSCLTRLMEGGDQVSIPRDLVVSWITRDSSQRETILLRSLLADCIDSATSEWDIEKVKNKNIVKFIQDVLNDANPRAKYLRPVQKLLRERDEGKGIAFPEEGITGYKQKTLAVIIEWAIDRTQARHRENQMLSYEKATIEQINSRLGLGSKLTNRALGRTLGNSDSTRKPPREPSYAGRELLSTLDGSRSWRYNQVPWLRSMVQEHLRELAKKDPRYGEDNWPNCLKPGRAEVE